MKIIPLLLVVFFFHIASLFSQGAEPINIDSAFAHLQKVKKDTNTVNELVNLASKIQFSNPQKALIITNYNLKLAQQINWKNGEAQVLNQQGIINAVMSKLEIAEAKFRESLALFEEIGSKSGIANEYGNIANIYTNQSNFSKSLEYHLKALKIDESLGNKAAIAKHYGNIGIIYYNMSEFEKAIKYNKDAIELYKLTKTTKKASANLTNISICYIELDKIDSALHYAESSLKLDEETGNIFNAARNLSNIGNIYNKITHFEKALEYYFKALDYNTKIENTSEIATTLSNIANLYSMLSLDSNQSKITRPSQFIGKTIRDDINSAIYYGLEAYKLSNEVGDKRIAGYSSQIVSKSYESIKDYENALKYYKISHENIDSVFNEGNYDKMRIMTNRFDLELSDLKLQAQERNLYFTVAIAIFILIILLIVIFMYFHKQKTYKQLEEKNRIITEINASKDKFFSILAHDLKSPFAGFLGLTKVLSENSDSLTKDEMQEMSNEMQSSASNLYALLENLLQWSNMQRGVISFNPEEYNLAFICMQNLEIQSELSKQKEIHLEHSIDPNISVFADIAMLNTVIRNLLSNALKFTNRGGSVIINAIQSPDNSKIILSVKDSGIGMSEEVIDKLFRVDQKVSRPGTENEPSTGLGLLLCKEFVEKNGGNIWVESEVNIGTTFFVSIPNMK